MSKQRIFFLDMNIYQQAREFDPPISRREVFIHLEGLETAKKVYWRMCAEARKLVDGLDPESEYRGRVRLYEPTTLRDGRVIDEVKFLFCEETFETRKVPRQEL